MSISFSSLGDKQFKVLAQYYEEFRRWEGLDKISKERQIRQDELQHILSRDRIDNISTDEIIHACTLLWSVGERFAGGLIKNNEIAKIRKTFRYLLYGNEDIFLRFEKVCSVPEYQLKTFGPSRISELLIKVRPDLGVSLVNDWTERVVQRLGLVLEYDEKSLAEKARIYDDLVKTIRTNFSFRNLDEVDLFIWFIDQFSRLFPDKRDPLQGFTGSESSVSKGANRKTRRESISKQTQTKPLDSSVFEEKPRVTQPEFVTSEEAVRPSAHATDDRWVLEDTLGYKPYAVGIYTFLTHPQTKPPLTIGIQAPWGGGKTSIMRIVQKELDPGGTGLTKEEEKKSQKKTTVKECHPESKSEKPFKISGQKPKMLTIWFNAWKYQNSEQIWAGLADAIVSQFAQRLEPEDKERFLLELNLRRVGKDKFQQKINKRVKNLLWDKVRKRLWAYLTGIGSSAIWFIVDNTEVLESIELHGKPVFIITILAISGLIMVQRNEAVSDADDNDADDVLGELVQVPDYRAGLGFIHHVNADMEQVLGIIKEYDKDMKLVIFIDDLDRCSPSNVADVFEGLNMFISAEFTNCFFIIGMDVEIVTAALEKAHSEIIEKMPLYSRRTAIGWRFMDKFVQMPIIIPPPEPNYVQAYTAGLFKADLPDAFKSRINVEQLITNLASNIDDAKWEDFFQSVKSVDKRDYAPQEQAALRTEFEITKNAIKTIELVRNIEKAKEEYSDQNPEVRDQVAKAVIDFSNNPREMKRFLNVLRFNYFLRDGRIRSRLHAPTPDQLRRWIVLTMKWPQVVLWLHRSSSGISFDKSAGNQTSGKLKILEEYGKKSMVEWKGKLGELLKIYPGENSVNWIDDEDLKNFFADENGTLSDAAETGLY